MHLIQVTIVVFSGQGECPIASVQWLTLVKLVRVPRNFVGRPASVYSGVTRQRVANLATLEASIRQGAPASHFSCCIASDHERALWIPVFSVR